MLSLQTRLNKVLFPTLVCSSVVSGAQSSTASCQLVPDHTQPLAGAFTEMFVAGLGQRETACKGDPVSCHSVGGTMPS